MLQRLATSLPATPISFLPLYFTSHIHSTKYHHQTGDIPPSAPYIFDRSTRFFVVNNEEEEVDESIIGSEGLEEAGPLCCCVVVVVLMVVVVDEGAYIKGKKYSSVEENVLWEAGRI